MTPLKKKRTFIWKWAVPYAVLVGVGAWQFHAELAKPKPDLLIEGAVGAMMFAILFFVIRRQSREEPDEVLDGGTFIRISYGGETEDIPISNLRAVETRTWIRLTRIGLLLGTPSKFGEVISFYPLQDKDASGENAVAASLRSRMNTHRV